MSNKNFISFRDILQFQKAQFLWNWEGASILRSNHTKFFGSLNTNSNTGGLGLVGFYWWRYVWGCTMITTYQLSLAFNVVLPGRKISAQNLGENAFDPSISTLRAQHAFTAPLCSRTLREWKIYTLQYFIEVPNVFISRLHLQQSSTCMSCFTAHMHDKTRLRGIMTMETPSASIA